MRKCFAPLPAFHLFVSAKQHNEPGWNQILTSFIAADRLEVPPHQGASNAAPAHRFLRILL
jgi:hypothetical protein